MTLREPGGAGLRRRWARLLLRIFPARFREPWGRDLLDLYEDRERDQDRRRFSWLRLTSDLLVNGLRLRLEDALSVLGRSRVQVRNHRRTGRGSMIASGLGSDLHQALRNARNAPGFTLLAVGILAIGIGANTAVFSVVDAVLIDALRFEQPDRLVAVWHRHVDQPDDRDTVSPGNLDDWQSQLSSFEMLAAYSPATANLSGSGEPRRVVVCDLVGGLFEVLRPRPYLGRLPTAADAAPGADRVAALGHAFWRDAFGADPAVIGRTLVLDGLPVLVVGVTPPEVGGLPLGSADVFRPRALGAELGASRTEYFLRVIGRLRSGVELTEAQAEIDLLMERLRTEHPRANDEIGARVEPLADALTSPARAPLLALLAAVVLVLLIGCVNLAHLLLVRMSSRESDFAVRRALGATTGRLLRSSLVEATTLALAGGLAGAVLAWALLPPLVSLLPSSTPRLVEVGIDGRVLSFALALSLLAGLLFGSLPALRLPRAGALRSPGTGEREALRGGRRLVVAEVSLAVVLLASAALLVRSVDEMRRVDLGFETEGTVVFTVRVAGEGYARAERPLFFDRLLDRLEQIPGVLSAGAAVNHPASGDRNSAWLRRASAPVEDGAAPPWTGYNAVTAGFFETLGVTTVRGRLFDERPAGPVEVVINEAAQRRFWPDGEPVGERVGLGPPGEFVEDAVVVGVVPDLREGGLTREPSPMVYFPYSAYPTWSDLSITLRTATDPLALVRPATDAVHAIDPDLPVYGARTSRSLVEAQVGPARAVAILLGTFAVLGLALAALGVAGVLAESVARRRREIGIRMALGASVGRVVRRLFLDGMAQVGAGAVIGLAISILAARALRSLLFRVSLADLPALGATLFLLLLAGAVAVALPAWRAARLQPSRVLRAE